jgi:hypothetical protein
MIPNGAKLLLSVQQRLSCRTKHNVSTRRKAEQQLLLSLHMDLKLMTTLVTQATTNPTTRSAPILMTTASFGFFDDEHATTCLQAAVAK